jgi:hypothetical protein
MYFTSFPIYTSGYYQSAECSTKSGIMYAHFLKLISKLFLFTFPLGIILISFYIIMASPTKNLNEENNNQNRKIMKIDFYIINDNDVSDINGHLGLL